VQLIIGGFNKKKPQTHVSMSSLCHHPHHIMPSGQPTRKRKQRETQLEPSLENDIPEASDEKLRPKKKRVKTKVTVEKEGVDSTIIQTGSLVNTAPKQDALVDSKLENFILFKAFDVIGDGGYRRFVLKNKNNGEHWAVNMYSDAQYTSRCLRATLQLVAQLAGNVPCVKLYKICQRVINDMNPPSVSTHGWCICALTGMRTENTTQLGRSNKGEVCYSSRIMHQVCHCTMASTEQ
jgi:hypothetical protein